MLLRIDNREKDLIAKLSEEGVNFEVKALDLGDIQVLPTNSDIPLFIIERKALPDLNSSIRDGRYREQKARLQSFRKQHGTRLLYIFEGILKGNKRHQMSGSTLLSCCVNTPLRDGIAVHRTLDLKGTVMFIERLLKNIKKWDAGWDSFMVANGGTDEKSVVQYAGTLKSKKKGNMTPSLCFMRQLATIPGVSAKMASAVKELYGSMSILVTAYLELEDEKAREALLADIKINGRRLGNVKSARIYQYLCGKSEDKKG